MPNFVKYSSLENHYQQKFIDKMQMSGFCEPDVMYQVTEKCHGSNFAFYAQADKVTIAKRTGFTDSSFFSCGDVYDRYELNIGALYCALAMSPTDTLIVYGELAGKGIQKEIDYGDKDFYVYDMKLNGKFMDQDMVVHMCELFDLKHVTVLVRECTFAQAMLVEEEYTSLILTTDADNFAEGIVIKPIKTLYLMNGSRVAVKKVAHAFKEKNGHKGKVKKPAEQLPDDLMVHLNDIAPYLCDNRLRSVISHVGIPQKNEFGMIAGRLTQDAISDYNKDLGIDIKAIADVRWKTLKKMIQVQANTLIRPNWVLITQGEW